MSNDNKQHRGSMQLGGRTQRTNRMYPGLSPHQVENAPGFQALLKRVPKETAETIQFWTEVGLEHVGGDMADRRADGFARALRGLKKGDTGPLIDNITIEIEQMEALGADETDRDISYRLADIELLRPYAGPSFAPEQSGA